MFTVFISLSFFLTTSLSITAKDEGAQTEEVAGAEFKEMLQEREFMKKGQHIHFLEEGESLKVKHTGKIHVFAS